MDSPSQVYKQYHSHSVIFSCSYLLPSVSLSSFICTNMFLLFIFTDANVAKSCSTSFRRVFSQSANFCWGGWVAFLTTKKCSKSRRIITSTENFSVSPKCGKLVGLKFPFLTINSIPHSLPIFIFLKRFLTTAFFFSKHDSLLAMVYLVCIFFIMIFT